ncbi:Short chain dehydrogenase sol3 [Lachnellula suecica]|uniref:Short chain dehydrogenase sol3 n=1 Tax=Lachnellula suecica TaxID=602035 RepID=A0A8T9C6S0_9HELO|nr:Short chain dehydrogenase sol3 [Lachnellula suecica]
MPPLSFFHSQLLVTPEYPSSCFAGQTIIVAGSNTGLGKEAARHFARLGASKIILAVRNSAAGEAAKRDIESSTNCGAKVLEVWPLDLASYASIKAFADRASALPRLDGHERMVQINVISTFYLALLMLRKLQASAKTFGIKPRLTIVTSDMHAMTTFPEWKEVDVFAALDDEKKARLSERYPTSKLLEILVVREVAPLLEGTALFLIWSIPGSVNRSLRGREGRYWLQ